MRDGCGEIESVQEVVVLLFSIREVKSEGV